MQNQLWCDRNWSFTGDCHLSVYYMQDQHYQNDFKSENIYNFTKR